jgi:hypothetical protein
MPEHPPPPPTGGSKSVEEQSEILFLIEDIEESLAELKKLLA